LKSLSSSSILDRETREPDGPVADYVAQRCRERGVLLSRDGKANNVLKIKPPMVFDEVDAERLVSVLGEVLGEDFVRGRGALEHG